MTNPETQFERELEVFRKEVEEAVQSFYAWHTVHSVARNDKQVYSILNRYAAFWNLTLRALQTNSLIALGRIFDNDRRSHRVYRLLELAEANPEIFSKGSLDKRKRNQSADSGEWIGDYMRDVYLPTARDFKRLRRYLDARRSTYDNNYKDLRDKFFSHKDRVDVTGFFAHTNIRELEQLLVFFGRLHDGLWELFQNGRKPNLRLVRYSTKSILKLPARLHRNSADQEWITHETKKFLNGLVESQTEVIRHASGKSAG